MLENIWVAVQLAASQEEFSSVEFSFIAGINTLQQN
jgi:hypothetical protein